MLLVGESVGAMSIEPDSKTGAPLLQTKQETAAARKTSLKSSLGDAEDSLSDVASSASHGVPIKSDLFRLTELEDRMEG